jgi:sensor histidine kinase regulating citrate/malate metabolism
MHGKLVSLRPLEISDAQNYGISSAMTQIHGNGLAAVHQFLPQPTISIMNSYERSIVQILNILPLSTR